MSKPVTPPPQLGMRLFEVDDAVEINGRAEDNQLCFYAATILSLSETEAEVRYGDLKTQDNRPVIENVGLQYLRPKPVNFSFDYKTGDAVNVWVKDRLWLGIFVARVGRSDAVTTRKVTFSDDKCRR
ncbi:hypothetical protein LXL04_037354 [Taraxacum kok-saghyz]